MFKVYNAHNGICLFYVCRIYVYWYIKRLIYVALLSGFRPPPPFPVLRGRRRRDRARGFRRWVCAPCGTSIGSTRPFRRTRPTRPYASRGGEEGVTLRFTGRVERCFALSTRCPEVFATAFSVAEKPGNTSRKSS
jgi:hypothetical protein